MSRILRIKTYLYNDLYLTQLPALWSEHSSSSQVMPLATLHSELYPLPLLINYVDVIASWNIDQSDII